MKMVPETETKEKVEQFETFFSRLNVIKLHGTFVNKLECFFLLADASIVFYYWRALSKPARAERGKVLNFSCRLTDESSKYWTRV